VFVCDITILSICGWEIVTVIVLVFAIASITIALYVPAGKLVLVGVVAPEGVQEYVYGETPPIAVIVALPFASPKQLTLVTVDVNVICENAIEHNQIKRVDSEIFFMILDLRFIV
jgi:hypothetical protein